MEAHQRRYGARHFYLVDKIVSAARYRKIGEAILARGLDVTYFGLAKPSAEFTPDVAEIAYRSGKGNAALKQPGKYGITSRGRTAESG